MNERYRMIRAGEQRAGTWSIFDMETYTVVKVRGRPLEGMDEATASETLAVLTRAIADNKAKATAQNEGVIGTER